MSDNVLILSVIKNIISFLEPKLSILLINSNKNIQSKIYQNGTMSFNFIIIIIYD